MIGSKLQSINQTNTANHIHLFKSDLMFVSESLIDLLPKIVFYVFRFIFAFVVLYLISARFALLFFILGALLLVVAQLLRKPISKTHQQALKQEGHMYTYMQDALFHLEVIKSFESEQLVSNSLETFSTDLFNKRMKKQKMSLLSSLGLNIFFGFGYAFSIIFGAYQISLGLLSVGSLTAIIQLVQNIQSPFSGMSTVIPKYYQTLASIERLSAITNHQKEDTNRYKVTPFIELNIDHVNFSYDDKPVLQNLNFTVKPNEIIWIKGKTGLGKTTLFNLLLGFLSPNSGLLSIKTAHSSFVVSSQTRNFFSYVPQNPFMMSQSIKDNLILGQTPTEQDIKSACMAALIYDDIIKTKDGFNTILGEHGLGLSKGQLQRLSIARALLRNSPIILLDEVTSALDAQTEKQVLENLKGLNNKTILIISHRDLSALNISQTIEIVAI